MGEEKLPLPLPPPPPLLLTTHGDESPKQSFYNLLENRYHTTCIPILNNKSVLCSAYGWLVLLDQTDNDSEGECCLWNPTSSEIIQLPVLEKPSHYNRCFLSKPPTDPDCFVLFNHVQTVWQVVYRVQENTVFKLDLAKQGARLLSMVSFRGTIYGVIQPLRDIRPKLISKYVFVTINMDGDKFEIKPLLIEGELPWEVPRPLRSWINFHVNYLIESPCGSELLLVTKMHNVGLDSAIHFRVYRVDVRRMECEELDYLDGRTIFINYEGNGFCRSYSESFGAAMKANSIYYTNENGMVLYVYDLDDRSTTTLLPYPDDADIDLDTAENFWVDLPDILVKNSCYFDAS